LGSLRQQQVAYLHDKEYSDIVFMGETANNSQTADEEVKQLNAEIWQ